MLSKNSHKVCMRFSSDSYRSCPHHKLFLRKNINIWKTVSKFLNYFGLLDFLTNFSQNDFLDLGWFELDYLTDIMELDLVVVTPKHVVSVKVKIQFLELMSHFGPVYLHLGDTVFIKTKVV